MRKFKKVFVTLGLLIIALMLAGCGAAAGGPRVWIDDPLPGASLPLDTVVVQSTSAAQSGIAQVTLLVNGEAVRSDSPGEEGAELATISQPWEPSEAGSYQIQIRAETVDGTTASSRTITVSVGEQPPTSTSEPTTESAPPTTEAPPTPTETATVTATPATEVPPISINFNADSYAITEGQCTTLRWAVEGADQVQVAGEAGSPVDARQVCPDSTTSYELLAQNAAEQQSARVTIEVGPPAGPPAAPGDLVVAGKTCNEEDGYTVTLSWSDEADNESGYRLYRDGSPIAEVGSNTEGYTDSPPGSGPYDYGVEAFNDSGASSRPAVEDDGCIF